MHGTDTCIVIRQATLVYLLSPATFYILCDTITHPGSRLVTPGVHHPLQNQLFAGRRRETKEWFPPLLVSGGMPAIALKIQP